MPRRVVGGFLHREHRPELGGWYLEWRTERRKSATCFTVGYIVASELLAQMGADEDAAWEHFMLEFTERVSRELRGHGIPHQTVNTDLSAKRGAAEDGLAIQRWFEGLVRVFGRGAPSSWEKKSRPGGW